MHEITMSVTSRIPKLDGTKIFSSLHLFLSLEDFPDMYMLYSPLGYLSLSHFSFERNLRALKAADTRVNSGKGEKRHSCQGNVSVLVYHSGQKRCGRSRVWAGVL